MPTIGPIEAPGRTTQGDAPDTGGLSAQPAKEAVSTRMQAATGGGPLLIVEGGRVRELGAAYDSAAED